MSYSKKCHDLNTHWNLDKQECVPCDMKFIKPGYEFSPNCGYTDRGGRRDTHVRACVNNTFNNGSHKTCQPCTSCPTGYQRLSRCNATTDTQCISQEPATETNATTVKVTHGSRFISTTMMITPTLNPHGNDAQWKVPIIMIIIACIVAIPLSLCFIYRRRKRRFTSQHKEFDTNGHRVSRNTKRSSPINEEFTLSSKNLEDILSPEVQSAPLQRVLDNLDVLEELVILLDPESQGVKNTRHLASHCSFPSTWITYTYSMKDSKSPLKAVLEGVTTKYPDWTVGHLAKLLRGMGRNDAIAVLAKLWLNEEVV